MKAVIGHKTRASCSIPTDVLVDIGAGGGCNYISDAFVKVVENTRRGEARIVNLAGKRFASGFQPQNQLHSTHKNRWFLHPFTGLPRDNASGRDTALRRGARGIVHAKTPKHHQL